MENAFTVTIKIVLGVGFAVLIVTAVMIVGRAKKEFQEPMDLVETFLSLVDDGQPDSAYRMMTAAIAQNEKSADEFLEAFSSYGDPGFAFGKAAYHTMEHRGNAYRLVGTLEVYGKTVPFQATLIRQSDDTFLFEYIRLGNKEVGRLLSAPNP